jgi:3-phosphoglycerate kinase
MAAGGRKLTVEDLQVDGKRVLVRVDFNVPLDDAGVITDDTRIREALPTLRSLVARKARIVLMAHAGRPKGKASDKLRLNPMATRLGELLGQPVKKIDACVGPVAKAAVDALKPGEVLMLENLRFHAEEEKNDPAFSKELASLGDMYVNDAFGTAHRAHASTVGVTKHLPQSAAGLLIVKEMKYLGQAMDNPQRPFTAVLGGAKVSSKLSIITKLAEKVDNILIGGGMAYTFLRAMNMSVGNSLVEEDRIKDAKEILKLLIDKNVKWLLPFDHVITDRIATDAVPRIVTREGIPDGYGAADIGPSTVEMFGNVLGKSKTIIWNGPMGVFEIIQFSQGTYRIALWMSECKATTIVGGGDSIAAINKLGIAHKFTHISTGGGASMEYIEGVELPGIAALTTA